MRKEKSHTIIYITIFIALIMILSVVGFLWSGGGEGQHKYGKLSFSYQNGEWITNMNGKQLLFSYLPEDVSNVSVPQGIQGIISNARMVYVAYDPSDSDEELAVAQFNLGMNLENNQRFVVNAVTSKSDSRLVITCANATQFVPVIIIKNNDAANSINLNNGCITLEGRPLFVADRITYAAYGII
jgi:hypothetical protein